ncbi:uncharacterized protein LOC108209426 [Daucus carota subsp. sativus]
MSYVSNIDPGLPLFLFNYNERKLHGIFESASSGKMNIDPYMWTADGSGRTMYPAQVQICLRLQCQALHEDQFKPIINDNYFTESRFWFELDHEQTDKLMSLMSSLAFSPSTSLPQNAARCKNVRKEIPLAHKGVENEGNDANSDVDFYLLEELNRDMPSASLEVVPGYSDNGQSSGLGLEKRTVPEDEKDYILMKLKEISLARQHSESLLKKSVEDTNIINEASLDMPSANSDVVPGYSGNGQSSGLRLEKRTVPEDERDYVLMKLKEISFACHHSDSLLKKSVENTNIVNDVSMEQSSIPEGQEVSREKVEPDTSYDYFDVISQLTKQLEEQESFEDEKLWGTEYEEQNLVEEEIELLEQQYIEEECRPNPCIEPVKEGLIEFSTEPDLNIEESMLLVGGYNGKAYLTSLDAYLPSKNKMKSLTPMSIARSSASVAQICGELYVFGGRIDSEWYNTVESYNPTDNKWILRPSLSGQPRGSLAGARLENKIFAIGGENGSEFFSGVEMLDLDLGRWIMTQSMLEKRFTHAAAELNGAIYVVGGCDGKHCLKSAERFDPREHSWTRIQSMTTKRSCPALTVMNEKLYVLGGFDGKEMVPSVEIYDPRNGSWMTGPAMNIPRGFSAAAVVKESMYVIGGVIDGVTMTDTVERYRENSGWEVIYRGSIACRCFASAIVL